MPDTIGYDADKRRLLVGTGYVENVDPAEQSLRLPVIFRKITLGSQSLHGAQALATNLSLITTAKRQGRDPLELVQPATVRPFRR